MKDSVPGLIAAAALLATASPAAASDRAVPARIARDIPYLTIGGKPLHLDVYVHPGAAKAPAPVLIHFHGGGWARGARPESWTGFRPYLAAGMSVVTVQYRLAGEARAPAAVQEARCALHWVGAHAADYGFDTSRIIVSGTSAGGHLALMAGLLPADNDIDLDGCKGGPKAAAILDFFGPTDLTAGGTGADTRHPTIENWIGSGAGAGDIERKMSPVTWLTPASPPVFIAHGDADPVVPVAQSIDLKKRLDMLSIPSDLFIAAGGGHGKFAPEQRAAMMKRAIGFLCGQKLLAARACTPIVGI